MADRDRRASGSLSAMDEPARAGRRPITIRIEMHDEAAAAHLVFAFRTAGFSVVDKTDADILVHEAGPLTLPPDWSASKLVLLADTMDHDRTIAALRAGARAVLPRSTAPDMLIQAVHVVAAGFMVLHPDMVAVDMLDTEHPVFADADPDATPAAPLEKLTERELQVLRLLADGLSNKAIARRLAISDHTVKSHLATVFSKLGARTRAEALALGLRFGLIHL